MFKYQCINEETDLKAFVQEVIKSTEERVDKVIKEEGEVVMDISRG